MHNVFISHVSDDKKRLTPFLDKILASDPGNVRIWVDKPRAILEGDHFKHDDQDLVQKIDIGDEWDASIEEALKAADVVMVFWSTDAKKKNSRVFAEEIYYARQTGKLVVVSLDLLTDAPFVYPVIQVADVAKYGEGIFDEALAKMEKIFLHGPKAQDPDIEIEQYWLPFLANRERNAALIDRQISRANRLGHYVVPCDRPDVFDKFTWRLAEIDGPKIWHVDGSEAPETWSSLFIDIDASDSLDDQREEIELVLEGVKFRNAFNDNILHDRPIVIYSELRADQIHANEIFEWIELWTILIDGALEKFDAKPEYRDKVPSAPICSILAVLSDPSFDSVYSSMPSELKAKLGRPRRLQKISRLNFQSWLMNEEVRNAASHFDLNLGALDLQMESHFSADGIEFDMKKFSDLVLATDAYREFIKNCHS